MRCLFVLLFLLPSAAGADEDRPRVIVTETKIQVFDNLTFAPDRSVIRPAGFPMLDALVETLKGNPELVVLEVGGYSDVTENPAVSLARANAVIDYLVAKGIAIGRLQPKGYGAQKPVSHREPGRNRRVAFRILQRH
jgi:outer membrane protein OmpA-like peptidoglycan-associated protein